MSTYAEMLKKVKGDIQQRTQPEVQSAQTIPQGSSYADRLKKVKSDIALGKVQAVTQSALQTPTPSVYTTDTLTPELKAIVGNYDPVKNRVEGQTGWKDYLLYSQQRKQNVANTEEKSFGEKLLGYLGDIGPDTSMPFSVDTNQIAEGYQEQEQEKRQPNDRWSEEQRYTFGYLWNTERKKAWEYAYAVNEMLNAKAEEEKQEQIQQDATKNFGAGVAHTAGAILSAPAGGLAETLGDLIAYGALGYLPGSDGETSLHEYSEAVKGGISSHLNEEGGTISEAVPIIGGKGWGDVYSLGTSIAQSLLSVHTGGGGQALISSFGSAVASGIDDAKARGATDSKAIGYGVLTGAAEAFAEMIGVDNLMKIGAADSMKAVLKNILKQGAAEGLEEGITSILNNFADNLVLQDKSKLNIAISDYMEKGMTREDAQKKAWLDMAGDVAFDMLGGFVSGNVSGGIQTGVKTAQAKLGSLEWVQGIAELGKGTDSKQNTEQAAAKQPYEVVEEILALGTNAPADPVGAALDGFKQTGTVTNKQATDILNNSKALQSLREQVGLELPETAAGRRNAIKAAVEQLAQVQAESSTQTTAANEQSGVKEQLRNNQSKLNTMEPAAEIQVPTEFSKMDKAGKQNWVVEKLRSTGYKVDRKGFGIIDFAKKRLKAAFKYFDSGSAEEAAFEALPYVLENGIEISSHSDHKGRAYRTVTIAAPVIINGKRGNMAVVVKQTDGNHYKVHRILTPDGAVFDLSETTNEADRADGGVTETGSLATSNGAASLETDVIGDTAAGHRQTQPLIPVPNTSISENEQGVNNESPRSVGAAAQSFTGQAAYQNSLTDENSQRDRPGDVRPVEVPKTDAQGNAVSAFVGNSYGSKLTTDRFTATIQRLLSDGELGHSELTNEKALESAAQDIADKGIARTLQSLQDTAQSGRTGANDVAKATLLYRYLLEQIDDQAQSGGQVDPELERMAADVFTSLTQMSTTSGRSLQLFSLFRKMTPEGQMMSIQNEIARYVARMKQLNRLPQDYAVEPIDDALFQEFAEASKAERSTKTEEERTAARTRMQKAQDAIYMRVAATMPATLKEKWDAWRHMSMLGNAKTQLRNVFSNAAYMPYVAAKRAIGAMFEKAIPQDQRTKAVIGRSKADRSLLNWAKNDAQSTDVQRALQYSSKLGDEKIGTFINEHRRIFDTDILEKARKLAMQVPQMGDLWFKNAEYAKSLAGFLKARGYTEADILSGKVDDSILNEGRAYAINEAMKATFNDANALSDALSSLRYKGDNIYLKGLSTLGEGIAPYRRTPANILVRTGENSVVGLARGIWNCAVSVKNGKIDAATAIDRLSAGLTGTGAMVLGIALGSGLLGVKLRGSDLDEDEKRQGKQKYSLEFSVDDKEYSYSIDWCSPSALPLFIGANVYTMLEENPDISLPAFFAGLIPAHLEPMLALTVLSSINDVLVDAKYADDGEELVSALTSVAASYFTQGIPALTRQLAQTIPENKQQTFANNEDPVYRNLEQAAGSIPVVGQFFKTDKIDEWGQAESNGAWWERALKSFFSPGTLSSVDSSQLEREIARLNEVQEESVSPPTTAKVITYTDKDGNKHTGQRLTEKQYNDLRTAQGQAAALSLNLLLQHEDYQALTETQKAKAFNAVYDYARETGRAAAIEGYPGYTGSEKEIHGIPADTIIKKVVSAGITDAFAALTESWSSGGEYTGAVDDLEEAYSAYDKLSSTVKAEISEEAGGRLGYYLTAKKNGIATDTFLDLYKTFYSIEKGNGNASAKASKWSYELEKAQEQGTITTAQKNILKENMNFWQMIPAETDRFDELTNSGLSADKADYITQLLDGIPPETGNSRVKQIQKIAAIAGADDKLSEVDQKIAMKSVLDDKGYAKYLRVLTLGLDTDDYAASYRMFLDAEGSGKKERTIAQYQQGFGVSYDVAKKLYEIYNPPRS